jgi:hypothetical protein
MKPTFKNSILLIFIILLYIFVPYQAQASGKGKDFGLYSNESGSESYQASSKESRSLGAYNETDLDPYNDDDYATGGLRAGGTENLEDGGNANKLPVGDGLPVFLLGIAVYGLYIGWKTASSRKKPTSL